MVRLCKNPKHFMYYLTVSIIILLLAYWKIVSSSLPMDTNIPVETVIETLGQSKLDSERVVNGRQECVRTRALSSQLPDHKAPEREARSVAGRKPKSKRRKVKKTSSLSHLQGQVGYGYVMVAHYMDQITAGSVNLLSLQCWVASLRDRVLVVQPFVVEKSHFGLELSSRLRNDPTLADIFNSQAWRRFTDRMDFAPLVSWKEFLSKAPRRIISVELNCARKHKVYIYGNTVTQFAQQINFTVVRVACLAVNQSLSASEFRELVYERHQPHEVTVLFNHWSGISQQPPLSVPRLPLSDLEKCERSASFKKFMDYIPLSQRIQRNGEQYIAKYLSSSDGYIAVMLRLEQMFHKHKLSTADERLQRGTACIKSILKEVKRQRKQGLTSVFLAMDTGKYGSSSFRNNSVSTASQLSHHLLHTIYKDISFEDWEETFESVSELKVPGYVAMLQLHIAMRAEVLLLAGGGSFQSIAERGIVYRHHSDTRVKHIREC